MRGVYLFYATKNSRFWHFVLSVRLFVWDRYILARLTLK